MQSKHLLDLCWCASAGTIGFDGDRFQHGPRNTAWLSVKNFSDIVGDFDGDVHPPS